MQEPSHLVKICLCVNMIHNGIDPNMDLGVQRFSHLEVPIKYQYLIGCTMLILTWRFFDSITSVD